MSEKAKIKRMKAMYPLRAELDKSYKNSLEAVQNGKPMVWAMVNWWEADPILKAMDVEVIYPENYGAIIAASGLAENFLDISDSEGYPTHLCGYARVNFGYTARMIRHLDGKIPPEAPLGGIPKPTFLLSQGYACDARVKWFQSLGRYMNVPVWMMETINPGVEEFFLDDAKDTAVCFVKSELKKFIEFLEKILGRKMDWDKYDEVLADTIELCQVAHKTFELRKAKPCPMHSRDFWSTMPVYLFLAGDIKNSLKLFKDMYDEVAYRVANKIGAVENEKYRLGFSEIPPWHSLNIFNELADRGWNFVVESWGYHPPLPLENIDKISDPLERHAVFHTRFVTGFYASALKDSEYFGYMGYPYLVYARDYDLDGLFLHPLITCRSTSTHQPYVKDLLVRKASVPCFSMEGDLVDLRLFDAEEALKKAELFEYTMEHYRKLKRN